jgi:HSP20 family protein
MAQINVNDSKNNSSKSSDWKPEEVPQLTVDVYRSGDSIFVVSTVAGVNPKDLDISVEGNTLSVKGIRRRPYSDDDNVLLLEECFWGEFYRELTINENLDVDRIKATLNQGVLIVEVPILKLSSHRRIEVDMQ